MFLAELIGRAIEDVGPRPMAFWDCGFESAGGINVCLV